MALSRTESASASNNKNTNVVKGESVTVQEAVLVDEARCELVLEQGSRLGRPKESRLSYRFDSHLASSEALQVGKGKVTPTRTLLALARITVLFMTEKSEDDPNQHCRFP